MLAAAGKPGPKFDIPANNDEVVVVLVVAVDSELDDIDDSDGCGLVTFIDIALVN